MICAGAGVEEWSRPVESSERVSAEVDEDECPERDDGEGEGADDHVVGGAPTAKVLRSHPAIDPKEARDPVAQEGPEPFSFLPGSAWATGDEPRSLLVSHDSIVVVCRPTSFGRDAPGMNRTCARGLGNRCSIH
jgi:hypothetical protein